MAGLIPGVELRTRPGFWGPLWPWSWAGLGAMTRWDINMWGRAELAAERITLWPCGGSRGVRAREEQRGEPQTVPPVLLEIGDKIVEK